MNETPAEEIKKAEEMQGIPIGYADDSYFNPLQNPLAISIIQQGDGNFKLWSQKNGKMVEIRAGKPEDCIQEFRTHE
jgi:hypothetical protein